MIAIVMILCCVELSHSFPMFERCMMLIFYFEQTSKKHMTSVRSVNGLNDTIFRNFMNANRLTTMNDKYTTCFYCFGFPFMFGTHVRFIPISFDYIFSVGSNRIHLQLNEKYKLFCHRCFSKKNTNMTDEYITDFG